ncbi:hypothetical protein L1987_52799 [Smallanthus sonchifolius]|uniref:Uncharacterized protein n=1 Tax=Smallanthus sonchifolius TaxID=185202 RepID=A0ACB9EUF3_9ASTR|nr:hypothetical protein L1987_52799 [Smallanthus sonchifolius]
MKNLATRNVTTTTTTTTSTSPCGFQLKAVVTFKNLEIGEPSTKAPQVVTPRESTKEYVQLYGCFDWKDEVNESLGWLTSRGIDMKARLEFHTDLATDMSGHMNEMEQDIMQNQERATTSTRDARISRIQSRVAIAKMPPQRNVRNANNNTGNGSDDLAQIVSQQLLDALPTLVEQIKDALKNDTENVERNSGINGGHNEENEHRRGCSYKDFNSCKPKDFYDTEAKKIERDGTLTKKGKGEKRKWNEGTGRRNTNEYDKKPTTARNFVAVTHDKKPPNNPR